jgi:hypothetical protein
MRGPNRLRLAPLAAGTALAVAGVAVAAVSTIDQPATVATKAVRGRRITSGPRIGDCPVFPDDNPWNQDISGAPLHPESSQIIARIQSIGGDFLHPDFGENPDYGIPYVVVPPNQPHVPVTFTLYGDESDPGPYPIPPDAPIEGGSAATGDRHVLVVRLGTCELFEIGNAVPQNGGASWQASGGARFDLTSNALRPLGWTSADAAGLPILAGLVRHDEVAAGEIEHAIRITFSQTRRGYILPATHFASNRTDPLLPPMGMRLRLRAGFDVTQLTGQARVIATAMQRYGVIVADNGSNWFFQGAWSPGWNDDDLNQLKAISGNEFEVVDTGPVIT